jgi:hypothetical protein
MRNNDIKEIINTEIIRDIADLIHICIKNSNESINRKLVQQKVKEFNDWNNSTRFYDFALNLTEEEQQMICNQVCVWWGF